MYASHIKRRLFVEFDMVSKFQHLGRNVAPSTISRAIERGIRREGLCEREMRERRKCLPVRENCLPWSGGFRRQLQVRRLCREYPSAASAIPPDPNSSLYNSSILEEGFKPLLTTVS